MFKNSPLASKYQRKVEGKLFKLTIDLVHAVNTIIQWWRPFYARLVEIRRNRWVSKHSLNLISKLRMLWSFSEAGEVTLCAQSFGKMSGPSWDESGFRSSSSGSFTSIYRRKQILQLSATYVIQRAWRNTLQKRIRARKVKTKNLAAIKIQAAWKGFWVRSRKLATLTLDTTLRFSYGEAVFLTAVRRNLYACHFILKMYRPCGIGKI